MTTEEKAKRYDEALNWMRELYPGLHGATKEDAEHYFPELRESEDERMLRKLIDHLDWHSDNRLTKEECDELRAYLEKQKEQKPTEWKPSEEQMEALEMAIEGKCPSPTSYLSRRLEEIYEQLKTL